MSAYQPVAPIALMTSSLAWTELVDCSDVIRYVIRLDRYGMMSLPAMGQLEIMFFFMSNIYQVHGVFILYEEAEY